MPNNQPSWKNWGDHPLVVGLGVIATLITIFVTIWGLPRIIRENITFNPNQIISKTPQELIAWYANLNNEIEATKQSKVLYIGKSIEIMGIPEIYAVNSYRVSFLIDKVFASMEQSDLTIASINSTNRHIFICRIDRVSSTTISVDKCKLEEMIPIPLER